MATPKQFRYSNGQIATSEAAASFSWEAPVPVNPFWDSIDYCTARTFLACFSDAKLQLQQQLPTPSTSTATMTPRPNCASYSPYSRRRHHPSKEEQVCERRTTTSGTPLHQALFRLQDGKFKEAEEGERVVLEWMESPPPGWGGIVPQAISAGRVVVRALWGQGRGRREEARQMLREAEGIVEGMEGGRLRFIGRRRGGCMRR
ncbi:hypothetical protein GE09DRAFT_1238051 [Coniochaeta sp. 2T2.1]|nr:hypothetical protein GE09DRAFT_1238051 [Coniochaeta sp. 2T2.1]